MAAGFFCSLNLTGLIMIKQQASKQLFDPDQIIQYILGMIPSNRAVLSLLEEYILLNVAENMHGNVKEQIELQELERRIWPYTAVLVFFCVLCFGSDDSGMMRLA